LRYPEKPVLISADSANFNNGNANERVRLSFACHMT
jgi:hypothetical protein